ncbi:unnamed protein product, partial [Didymodactylos carnosus]
MALAIGNGGYIETEPIHHAIADATNMCQILAKLQFHCKTGFDLSQKALNSVVNDFIDKINNNDIVLLYYSGH